MFAMMHATVIRHHARSYAVIRDTVLAAIERNPQVTKELC